MIGVKTRSCVIVSYVNVNTFLLAGLVTWARAWSWLEDVSDHETSARMLGRACCVQLLNTSEQNSFSADVTLSFISMSAVQPRPERCFHNKLVQLRSYFVIWPQQQSRTLLIRLIYKNCSIASRKNFFRIFSLWLVSWLCWSSYDTGGYCGTIGWRWFQQIIAHGLVTPEVATSRLWLRHRTKYFIVNILLWYSLLSFNDNQSILFNNVVMIFSIILNDIQSGISQN